MDDNCEDEMSAEKKVELEHHKQLSLCTTRAAYRQGRNLTAVKTYTINNESLHLLVFGVPKINVRSELRALCRRFGPVRLSPVELPVEPFTECLHAQYARLQSARAAKRALDTRSFYGGALHVCYAPERESPAQARAKLLQRRADVAARLRFNARDAATQRVNNNNDDIPRTQHVDDGNTQIDNDDSLKNSTVKVRGFNQDSNSSPYESVNVSSTDFSSISCTLSNTVKANLKEEKVYVFKSNHKRKSHKIVDKEVKKALLDCNVIGPQAPRDACGANAEAVAGRVVVCDSAEKPRVVKMQQKPLNRIVFNVGNGKL